MVYGVGRVSKTCVKMLSNNKFPYDSSQEKRVKVQRFKGSGFKVNLKYRDAIACRRGRKAMKIPLG